MDIGYLFLVFFAMAAVTFAERALPFAASKWLQKQRWVRNLGDFLPLAIMVLLTVHAATDAAVARAGSAAQRLPALLKTAGRPNGLKFTIPSASGLRARA